MKHTLHAMLGIGLAFWLLSIALFSTAIFIFSVILVCYCTFQLVLLHQEEKKDREP